MPQKPNSGAKKTPVLMIKHGRHSKPVARSSQSQARHEALDRAGRMDNIDGRNSAARASGTGLPWG